MLSPEDIDLIKEYARTNLEMAGDGVLHDPVLRRDPGSKVELTEADIRRSEDMILHSCVHSSKYHAARDILVLLGIQCDDI